MESAERPGEDIAAYDLPTLDRIPIIKRLLDGGGEGLCLDIGAGTGYATRRVFGDRPTVALDVWPDNLAYHRLRSPRALCVAGSAVALPFGSGRFARVLCSEVLEHIEDHERAAAELARVLAPGGRAVVTVPYAGRGFTSFLELFGIRTVHDFPGPELHVRPGYDEASLRRLFAAQGLAVESFAYCLRYFTKAVVDAVSLCHLVYQRTVHRRRAWTWAEAAAAQSSAAFRVFRGFFPVLKAVAALDRLLPARKGFGLIALLRKPPAS